MIAAEGAAWVGGKVGELGEPDAFGHRRKDDVGDIHGVPATVVSVANYADLDRAAGGAQCERRSHFAASCLCRDRSRSRQPRRSSRRAAAAAVSGRMTAIRGGRYTHVAVPDPRRGPRTVDVARYYNAERFRPRYDGRNGFPVMLSD